MLGFAGRGWKSPRVLFGIRGLVGNLSGVRVREVVFP